MRKVILGTMMSLDGVMQAPGGPEEDRSGGFRFGGWTVHHSDAVTGEFIGEMLSEPYDLLLGRKTYEIFAAYWPHHDDPIANTFNAVTKYVATSSTAPLTWKKSIALHDAGAEVAKLKRGEGPNLLIQGSGGLAQTLLANDLVDEIRLTVFPLLLGRGKRLFGEGTMPAGLKLVQTRTSPSGVAMSIYARAGGVTTGSFADDNPSAAEIARRRKIEEEG